ncbi:winged helix-turn-helix domain-containing protein [Mycoplasmatota bacterium WC30]
MDENNTRIISTGEELKIISDPYRMEIINTYRSKDKALTATECANLMGEIPSKVHYHIKKLLKINILAFDHIKVINGINAKYYKLPKPNILIRLEDEEQQKMFSGLNNAESVVVNMIDTFKSNFIEARKKIDSNVTDESEIGKVATTRLYLSEADHKKLMDDMETLLQKYILNDDESKKKYDFLVGIMEKIK